LELRPLSGTWYRAINARYWETLLETAHTARIPGRFNAGCATHPGFEVLYFGEDHLVTLFEAQALLGSPDPHSSYLPNPNFAWVIINVEVQLRSVADLTRRSQRITVGTTVQELTGDWRGYALRPAGVTLSAPHWTDVPTQLLGYALHQTPDLEGFLTYSAKVTTKRNLVVFPTKLGRGSSLRFFNSATGQTHTITGESR
jgi:RES domain-containing protein